MVQYLHDTSRDNYILDQGFTTGELKPEWWRAKGIEIQLPSGHGHDARLTRADLFRMGSTTDTDDALLAFVWHVLAWGSGVSRRNNAARIQSCTAHVDTLREAINAARRADIRAAYGLLVRPGRATIPRLGPAFFTKILYFASEGAAERCLILDARVARSLYRMGWAISPRYSDTTRTFSYNWYTDTYVSYCELLHIWATAAGGDITADMFERALFDPAPGVPTG